MRKVKNLVLVIKTSGKEITGSEKWKSPGANEMGFEGGDNGDKRWFPSKFHSLVLFPYVRWQNYRSVRRCW